ncbi:MAG: very short patch repair endonuclease [Syntrophobacteraceae bacterium]
MSIERPENGTDIFSKAKRSQIMSVVRSKDTKPEKVVRSKLHAAGFRFRLHRHDLTGNPDIVLPKHRVAIFVHGCFWHQHPNCKKKTIPKQNSAFWEKKLLRNVQRDHAAYRELTELGWEIVVIWECEVKKRPDGVIEKIEQAIIGDNGSADKGHFASKIEERAIPT